MATRPRKRSDVMIRFITPNKKEVGIDFPPNFIYERPANAPVHYRADPGNSICTVCGGHADVWMDTSSWEVHPDRCTEDMDRIVAALGKSLKRLADL